MDQPSWRDTIRASGLNGLAALGDKRALELGIKYYVAGNPSGVRSAALSLLGSTGKDDPRVLPILTAVLNEGAGAPQLPANKCGGRGHDHSGR